MIHPLFRIHGNVSNFINLFSGEQDLTGVGGSGPYCFYLPRDLTIGEGTLSRGAAPGVGATVRLECYNGTEGTRTQTGADVDLSGTNATARATVNGSWPAAAAATAAGGDHIELSTPAGAPGLDNVNLALQYDDSLDPSIAYYGFGDRVANLLSGIAAATNRFTTAGVSDSTTATESNVQLPWPLAGTFQYVAMAYSGAAGNGTTTLALRVNGADSALTFSLAETASVVTLVTNSVLTATVAAGDLVNWRMSRDGAGAGGFTCALVWGFKAS